MVTNADKILIGNGDALTLVIQRGATGIAVRRRQPRLAPTFNVGAGGLAARLCAVAGAPVTTGPEIPTTRSVLSIQILNPTGVTLAGGDLTATGTVAG